MCVQIHTVCELTHGVQNYTVVPFAYNMKKIPLTWIFLHSRRDWRDWQIWGMCMCVFVYLYFCIYVFNTWEYQFLISLKNPLFKNMPHVGSFWHFTICFICVFCICICRCLCIRHHMIEDIVLFPSIFHMWCLAWSWDGWTEVFQEVLADLKREVLCVNKNL